jgi:hypothetical protein
MVENEGKRIGLDGDAAGWALNGPASSFFVSTLYLFLFDSWEMIPPIQIIVVNLVQLILISDGSERIVIWLYINKKEICRFIKL